MYTDDIPELPSLLFIVMLIAAGTWIVTLTYIVQVVRSQAERNRQGQINQGNNETAGDREEGRCHQNEDDGLSASFAALIRTIEDQGRRDRDEERREDSGNAFREGLTILLLSGTLVAISWHVVDLARFFHEGNADRGGAGEVVVIRHSVAPVLCAHIRQFCHTPPGEWTAGISGVEADSLGSRRAG